MTTATAVERTSAARWSPSYTVQVRHTIGGSPYCVPAALSALTGLTTLETTKLIQDEIGQKPILWVFYPIALKILGQLGFVYQEWGFLEQGGLYLICFHGHVGVIDGTGTGTSSTPSSTNLKYHKYIDNSNPTGTNLGIPRNRQIEKIFRIWKETT